MSDVEADFKRVLAAMHFLSYGTTGALEGRVTGGKEKPLLPAGGGWAMFHEFEDRWKHARSVQAKLAVLEAARASVAAYRRQEPREVKGESLDELYDRLTADRYEGEKPGDVAHWERSTTSVVRKARLARDREPEYGLPKGRERVASARERVLALHAKRCTVRQIEAQTGVPRSTVQRILKNAA